MDDTQESRPSQRRKARSRSRPSPAFPSLLSTYLDLLLAAAFSSHGAHASLTAPNSAHHMQRSIPLQSRQSTNTPLQIANWCAETIYPGIITQGGTGPYSSGFELSPGSSQNLTVSADWQGRVWGRTNCSFGGSKGGGNACGTGDCNGAVQCSVTGNTPVTLAEFTLDGGEGQSYYDISLVDGYNLPMAIVVIPNYQPKIASLAPNLTNPSCVASVGDLTTTSPFNPYANNQPFLGTNSTYPLAFTATDAAHVAAWCPWDLQVSPPTKPGDGVYPYPDGGIQRPLFDPCFSACARYNDDADCCNGKYNSPQACKPNYYSTAAKAVCPDAYSFAFDDQTSTFIIPTGAGFGVVFCPGGQSTQILNAKGGG